RRAHRLETPPESMRSSANPSGTRRAAISSRQPASSGVTELRAISSQARDRVEVGAGVMYMVLSWRRTQAAAGTGSGVFRLLVGHVEGELAERGAVRLGTFEVDDRRRVAAALRLGRSVAQLGVVDQPVQVGGRIGVGQRFVQRDGLAVEQV